MFQIGTSIRTVRTLCVGGYSRSVANRLIMISIWVILFSLYTFLYFLTFSPVTATATLVSSLLTLSSFHCLSWFAYYSHFCWAYDVTIRSTVNTLKKRCAYMCSTVWMKLSTFFVWYITIRQYASIHQYSKKR